MKIVLLILLVSLSFQGIIHGMELLPLQPIEFPPIDTITKIGPAHLFQNTLYEIPVPKVGLKESLEQKLLATRLVNKSI